MSVRSTRREAAKKVRIELVRKHNMALSLALFGAALPFTPLYIPMFVAAAAAMYCLGIEKKIAETEKPIIWDSGYTEAELGDCESRRSTFLGKVMPWGEWKDCVDELATIKGNTTADDIRATLAAQYGSMIPFMLSDDVMTRHVALLAATGTGKTELLLAIIQQQIRKGAGLIMVEAKSDSDLSGAIYEMMKAANRLDEFRLINFEFPKTSHTYNPFYSGGVRATISTAMKIQANSSEQFWNDVTKHSLTAAILTMKLQPEEPAFHIQDIIAILSDFDLLLDYISKIREQDSDEHFDGKRWLYSYLRYWRDEQKGGWNTGQFKTLLLGLITRLGAFAHSEYSRIVNTYSPEVDIKEAILNNHVVVLSMSALADNEGVKMFGQLFISDLARAIGEIQLEKSKPLMICPAIFDEYPSFMDESHITLFQLARSANVPIIIAFQGVGFLEKIDPTFVETVLGNCWTHIYCDVRDTKTRQFAVTLAGTVIRQYLSEASGTSSGTSHGSDESGLISNDNKGASSTTSTKATREELLQPEDFSTLDQGDGIIVAKSGTYRVRLPLVRNTFPNTHFSEMKLVRRHKQPRNGVMAWERLYKKNKELMDPQNG